MISEGFSVRRQPSQAAVSVSVRHKSVSVSVPERQKSVSGSVRQDGAPAAVGATAAVGRLRGQTGH